MNKQRNGSLEKSARLVILMRLQDAGRLRGLSLQRISDLFIVKPSRMTIMRDLKDIVRLRVTLAAMEIKEG